MQFEQGGLVTRTFRRLDPDRQQAVINAILEEASEKGPTALSIKEVARRAKVSIGSLYQYFGSRQGLLDFAVALCVRYMVEVFKQYAAMLAGLPLAEALRSYLLGGIEWGRTEDGLVRFFGRAAYQGDQELTERVVRPVAEELRKMVSDILSQAVERGEIRPEVDLEAAARAVNTLMIAVGDAQLFPELNVYFQVSDENMPLERVIDAMVEMLLRGLIFDKSTQE